VIDSVPLDWQAALSDVLQADSSHRLAAFVGAERARPDTTVFPASDDVFNALALTPPSAVRAVILGQDPYHGDGEAHGLSFSVRPGTRTPPSLRNILREWSEDLDRPAPASGSLEPWARNGVLLLNAVLTVRRDQPNSHRNQGWEVLTDAVIRAVAAGPEPVAFLLWGTTAQSRRALIGGRHVVVASNHPSPLSATRPPAPFRGSRPFSTVNARLAELGRPPIDWNLDEHG
jgi:uracil-DNA glycosylase